MPYLSKRYWNSAIIADFVPFIAPENFTLPSQYADFGCKVNLYAKFKAAKSLNANTDLAVEIDESISSIAFTTNQVGTGQTLTVYQTVGGTEISNSIPAGGQTFNFTSGSTNRYMIRTSPSAVAFTFPIGCVWGYMCCVNLLSSINSPANTTLKYVFFTKNTLTNIGSFRNTGILGKVTIPIGVTSLDYLTFAYTGISKVVTSDNLSVITGNNASGAFYNCTSLTEVDLGTGLTYIGVDTFNGATAMATVIVRAATPPALEGNSLRGLPTTCVIKVPSGSVAAYKAATYWSVRASQIVAI